ncbi:MAG: hypothetical protein RLY16_604 [Bacteroidota bacterium]|jgi:L-ascorbate metabolism protein UlaG (beta-lactamase superfamily)
MLSKNKQRPTHNPELQFIKNDWQGNPQNQLHQYINLDGPSEKSFKELIRWQRETNPYKAMRKKQQSNVQVTVNPNIIDKSKPGFVWLGHASYLFQIGSLTCITDPLLYKLGPMKRYTALPCHVSDLTNIDLILLSHNHRDHCDQKSMQQLCKQNPHAVIYTGLEIAALLRKWKITNPIVEAGWYQQYPSIDGVTITYLPARHWNRRGLTDLNEMLWGSFMLCYQQQQIYFGADSGLGQHFEEIGQLFPNINQAFLGVGAFEPKWFMYPAHTGPEDALVAFQRLGARQLIPMHFGTFDLSDEPVFYPRTLLKQLAAEQELNGILHADIGVLYPWN